MVIASSAGLLALITATALAVYKLRGMTSYGWRKQYEDQNTSSDVNAGTWSIAAVSNDMCRNEQNAQNFGKVTQPENRITNDKNMQGKEYDHNHNAGKLPVDSSSHLRSTYVSPVEPFLPSSLWPQPQPLAVQS